MEIALVIAIVLVAAVGLVTSFRRSLTGAKKTCSCGREACAGSACCGQVVFGNPDCCDSTLEQAKCEAPSGGQNRQGYS